MDDTIVAISTPIGEGGIGIVRMSGTQAIKIADRIFRAKDGKAPSQFETYTTHYGLIVDKGKEGKIGEEKGEGEKGKERKVGGENGKDGIEGLEKARKEKGQPEEVIDEVILTVMRAPKSYTKEDIVEINCHGGIQAVKRVMELTLKHGAKMAEPGEFTKRAFLNGRIDLTQAEAVLDVIRAKTEGSLKVAVRQLEGELSREIDEIREEALDIAAQIEASIDFPEEELELSPRSELSDKAKAVTKRTERLIKSYANGVVFREGLLVIICGKPNAGKSSLMNLLLKRDRVIVSPIPGTTRDAVEEIINLNGIPMRLVDTAGISDTKDILEREGVKKSKKYLELSDMVILMIDASTPIDAADKKIIALVGGKKKIVVFNKIDLANKADLVKLKKNFKADTVVEVSVKKRDNIGSLEQAMQKLALSGGLDRGEAAIVSNARHKEALDKAYGSMLSVNRALADDAAPEIAAIDLKEAIFNLGLVIGKSASDDILDRIFSRFCIGK
ncbi:MAG: tRNA uridine-5-carboxymethylaminomethyl(34) synthesis GTPase MnmE [Candidatus Omnitrophota bacterium]|nr:tRNA uridine-5-carboxymethylaminomethyl(34) synthesis GTPase MnmE [Candidatus Omnitrophota bacterium]